MLSRRSRFSVDVRLYGSVFAVLWVCFRDSLRGSR